MLKYFLVYLVSAGSLGKNNIMCTFIYESGKRKCLGMFLKMQLSNLLTSQARHCVRLIHIQG